MMSEEGNKETFTSNVPWWIKSILLVGITAVFCYKVIQTPLNIEFDFPSFLALLLALFSVGLAAMFYFKATDSSNKFYDNTYKFTRDIADLLVRIESGFGEKLRHLDEAYKGMQDRFDQLPNRFNIKEVEKDLKEEEKESQKIIKEKEDLIENLMGKAKLDKEEKIKFLQALKEKEISLQKAHAEQEVLRNRLLKSEIVQSGKHDADYARYYTSPKYSVNNPAWFVLQRLGPEYVVSSTEKTIKRRFNHVKGEIPESIINSFKVRGLIDEEGNLTAEGVDVLKVFAMDSTFK